RQHQCATPPWRGVVDDAGRHAPGALAHRRAYRESRDSQGSNPLRRIAVSVRPRLAELQYGRSEESSDARLLQKNSEIAVARLLAFRVSGRKHQQEAHPV